MIVGTLRVRLLLRDAHSLKDKRRVIRSLKVNFQNKFNVAVAEVDHHDVWQTAELGLVTVGGDTRFVMSVLSELENFVRYFGGVVVTDLQTETFGA